MKPKDLKNPLTWKERRPLIHDRILYVPEYYDRHHEWTFPGWDSLDVFGRIAPVEVEYCAGNGDWIIEKALKFPERNWVAVEIQFERVRKIWSKLHNFHLSNLFIVCGEALTFTQFYVPSLSVSATYINFPDPWPKERHAKNRLIQEPFAQEMARICLPGSITTIVSDHFDYTCQASAVMRSTLAWRPCFPDPYYVINLEGYGTSYFDNLWKKQGLIVHYLQFVNQLQGQR